MVVSQFKKIDTSYKFDNNKYSVIEENQHAEEEETKEEETKEEENDADKYKIIIATYTQEAFYKVPIHINAENCFIKYGTLIYEDNGENVENENFIMSEEDNKYPSNITDATYEDYSFFFE